MHEICVCYDCDKIVGESREYCSHVTELFLICPLVYTIILHQFWEWSPTQVYNLAERAKLPQRLSLYQGCRSILKANSPDAVHFTTLYAHTCTYTTYAMYMYVLTSYHALYIAPLALSMQLFIHNFVHGDLHPGNILVQETQRPRLVLLDCGIATSLTQVDLMQMRALFTAIVKRQVCGPLIWTMKNAQVEKYTQTWHFGAK